MQRPATLAASEAIAARDLLAACEVCAAIAADLRLIAAATRELGPAAGLAATTRAPRDFRLSEADAVALRRRRVLGPGRFAGGLAVRARGFGAALAAFGLVGLLASTGVASFFGGTGGATTSESAADQSKDLQSMAIEAAPAADAAGPAVASEAPARVTGAMRDEAETAPGGSAPLVIGSLVALLAGLALLLASRTGRRAGP